MTTILTRDLVMQEISRLDREIADLLRRGKSAGRNLPVSLQGDLDELEESIVFARQFTSSNVMDFRQVEVGLQQLRALKAEILFALDELGI